MHYPTTQHLLSTCTPTRRGTARNAPATLDGSEDSAAARLLAEVGLTEQAIRPH